MSVITRMLQIDKIIRTGETSSTDETFSTGSTAIPK